METNRIKQFCVLCETQNMRAAAELLHLTHSALSKSMKVLQMEVNKILLQPEGRGIQITDEGQEFYLKAKLFLQAEEEMLKTTSKNISFRVGTFEIFSTYLIPRFWDDFFADQKLELQELLPGRMEAALLENRIDIGISYEPIPTAGVEFMKLGKISHGVFVKAGKLEKTPLQEIPFVAPVSPLYSIPTGPKGLDGWPDDEFERKVNYRVDMLESGLALVRQGKAAIFIPRFLATLHNDQVSSSMRLVEISHQKHFKTVYRNVYLIKRKSMREDDQMKKLARMLRMHCLD